MLSQTLISQQWKHKVANFRLKMDFLSIQQTNVSTVIENFFTEFLILQFRFMQHIYSERNIM
jgi:hypothetical protein